MYHTLSIGCGRTWGADDGVLVAGSASDALEVRKGRTAVVLPKVSWAGLGGAGLTDAVCVHGAVRDLVLTRLADGAGLTHILCSGVARAECVVAPLVGRADEGCADRLARDYVRGCRPIAGARPHAVPLARVLALLALGVLLGQARSRDQVVAGGALRAAGVAHGGGLARLAFAGEVLGACVTGEADPAGGDIGSADPEALP